MTSDPIEVVQSNSDAFSRRDVDAMLVLWASDAEMNDRRSVGWGEYQGHDALRAYYQGMFDNVETLDEELRVVSAEGDVVIAQCHTRAKLAGDPEADLTFDYAMRITLAAGLITALEIFENAQAAAASGPP
jgi:ketosteroid isomerase-like protein